jgi:[pyruvate, water dikinase]-phosphate phosphotransferase / [pyruvate, water dikinase] kinase
MFINRFMNEKYNVYLVSDSTGETLDRLFLSIKSQFANFEYEKKEFAFVRTEQQIDKIIKECNQINNCLILYTIVETKLAKYISSKSEESNVPCFGILGNLILSFSKLLNQKAIHKPSAQHVLDEDYYKRIEAIQFTMAHDDGKKVDDINNADIVLLGVSRTSKTPTSIYLANRGYKTVNVPLVLDQKIPNGLEANKKLCIIGLVADPERLADIRRNRVAIMKDHNLKEYTDLKFIKEEVENSKKLFKKNNWPIIDVTRRSVEETAASILKIIEIKKNK